MELFIEAGFDIINPVQCSAMGMDPKLLKARYGSRLTFWGGGVDTQKTLPFGTKEQVRDEDILKGRRLCVQCHPQHSGKNTGGKHCGHAGRGARIQRREINAV